MRKKLKFFRADQEKYSHPPNIYKYSVWAFMLVVSTLLNLKCFLFIIYSPILKVTSYPDYWYIFSNTPFPYSLWNPFPLGVTILSILLYIAYGDSHGMFSTLQCHNPCLSVRLAFFPARPSCTCLPARPMCFHDPCGPSYLLCTAEQEPNTPNNGIFELGALTFPHLGSTFILWLFWFCISWF